MDKKSFDELKENINYFTIGEDFEDENLICITTDENFSCCFKGDSYEFFDEIIEKLYISNKQISSTLSEQYFKEKIIEELYNNRNISAKEIETKILEIPLKKFTVVNEIYGVNLVDNETLKIGEFKIFNFEESKNLIGKEIEIKLKEEKPNYLISIEVKSRDQNKAIEIAQESFTKFVNLLRVFIGNPLKNIPINYNLSYTKQLVTYCYSGESLTSRYENKNNIKNIVLEKYQIEKNFNEHYLKLLEILVKENKTDFELRIENSLKWLSDSYFEKDLHIKFLKAMIAFEVLFTYSEKTLVNPSIASQISETVAFVIGENIEEKIEIEKRMKDFYSIRSSIAHSGKFKINEKDYLELCKYMTIVLILLTTKKDFEADSTKEFYEKIRVMKYS